MPTHEKCVVMFVSYTFAYMCICRSIFFLQIVHASLMEEPTNMEKPSTAQQMA